MDRCEYCEYKHHSDCGGVKRVSKYVYCDDFKLRFDALSEAAKKSIQKYFMEKEKY